MFDGFRSAIELLKPGECALVLFTRGPHFVRSQGGAGSTGWWRISRRRRIDRVVLYLRGADQEQNELFTASFDGLDGPRDDGKFRVRLSEVTYVGTSTANWSEFADTNSGPMRYVSARAKS